MHKKNFSAQAQFSSRVSGIVFLKNPSEDVTPSA